jgi:T5SS/PEP-CTERM-associated repeat protein
MKIAGISGGACVCMVSFAHRFARIQLLVVLVMHAVFGIRSVQAQYTSNNQTNVISGITTNWIGNYIVGHTNYADVLIIQNGGVLVDWIGALGAVYTSSNNLAVITGSGSAWTNNGYLILSGGDISYGAGPGNRMVIADAGTVYSYHGYVGGYVGGSFGSNSVLITDSGSAWITDGQFVVGDGSLGNSLVISNGGSVISSDGYLGYSIYADGSVLVTGSGSIWTNRANLQVGSYGGNTRLTIQNGGKVVDATGYIGYASGDNQVVVTDPGSIWTNRNDLYIANAGANNSLILTNSGAVFAGNLVVGSGGQGSLIVKGGVATVAALIATNGTNSLLEFDAGIIVAGSVLINNGPVFTIGDGVQPALLQMTGPANTFMNDVRVRTNATLSGCATINGTLVNDGTFLAGCGGRYALMSAVTNNGTIELQNGTTLDVFGPMVNNGRIIATGGTLRSYSIFVNNGTITGNYQDMHNLWTNSADGKWEDATNWSQRAPTNDFWCVISNAGSKTVLFDSATVAHPEVLTITALTLNSADASTNTLSLTDPGLGTPLRVLRSVTVGTGGNLAVADGSITIGELYGESLVDDGEISLNAASLTATNGLTLIGVGGPSQMTVSNSAINLSDLVLGNSKPGRGSLTVVGSNSVFDAATFYVGKNSADNRFNLAGGRMSDTSGQIGYADGSSNNIASVTGPGTVWSNRTDLFIGFSSPANQLLITEGGFVTSGNGVVGNNPTALGNLALIAGSGSVWSNRDVLTVGASGAGNSLILSNGGFVSSSTLKFPATNFVGYASDSNSVLVSDPGSVWRASAQIRLGHNCSGNRMVITNGGLVDSSSGTLGGNTNSASNGVWIIGPGSAWTNTGSLTVGLSGSANSLVITNGGLMNTRDSTLGLNSSSGNNTALISGSGSLWNAGRTLIIGNSGSGNSLVIDSNAQVNVMGRSPRGNDNFEANGFGYIGFNASSSNNSVRVMGGGHLQCLDSLNVGYRGDSNSLVISGGSVLGGGLTVGFTSAGCDNLLRLDGGNLIITNQTTNAIFEVRRGKVILNGGVLQADKLIITNACAQLVNNGGTLIVRSLVLDSNLSAVGDGIPNSWKQRYGFDPFDPTVSTSDADHDGASNLQEYLAGTNPANTMSLLHIMNTTLSNGDVRVTWSTVGGRSYTVQTSSFAGIGFADAIPFITSPGTNESTTNYLDIGAATNASSRFYRIRLAP